MTTGQTAGRIFILMGLYNGAPDLAAQLQSLADQSWTDWDLIVSDDGSSDAGPDMIRAFARQMAPRGHQVHLVTGPGRGFAANFVSMIAQIPADAGGLAFCDQDDVWLPERLARGVAALKDQEGPALYCSRTWVTDAALQNRRLSRLPARAPSFENALVQNVAAGNTILVNPAGLALLHAQADRALAVADLPAHDWWVYQVITGCGGAVVFDPEPTLLYRQHPDNLIGANQGVRSHLVRLWLLLGGLFAKWNRANMAVLTASGDCLTPENRDLVTRFDAMRRAGFFTRLRRYRRLGVYRQGLVGQVSLWLAVLSGRI